MMRAGIQSRDTLEATPVELTIDEQTFPIVGVSLRVGVCHRYIRYDDLKSLANIIESFLTIMENQ